MESELKNLIAKLVSVFPLQGGIYLDSQTGAMTPASLRLIDEKVLMNGIEQVLDEAAKEIAEVIPEPNENNYELTIPYERTHLEEDRERYKCFKKWFGDVVKTPQ